MNFRQGRKDFLGVLQGRGICGENNVFLKKKMCLCMPVATEMCMKRHLVRPCVSVSVSQVNRKERDEQLTCGFRRSNCRSELSELAFDLLSRTYVRVDLLVDGTRIKVAREGVKAFDDPFSAAV